MNLYKDRSPIHGYGCFTKSDLPRGSSASITGYVTSKSDKFTIQCGKKLFRPYAPFCFLNHSGHPNCMVQYCDDMVVTVTVIRKIKAGEELKFDYGC